MLYKYVCDEHTLNGVTFKLLSEKIRPGCLMEIYDVGPNGNTEYYYVGKRMNIAGVERLIKVNRKSHLPTWW